MYGALKSGGCYVPVDPGAPPVRCGQIVRDSRAAFLLSTSDLLKSVKAELGESNLRSVVLLDGAPAQPLKIGAEPISRDLPIVSFKGASEDSRSLPEDLQVTECDAACIYYTSGSTGTPKGAMRSHRSTLVVAEDTVDYLGLTPSDRFASVSPLHFVGSAPSFLGSCRAGAALVLIPDESVVFPSQLVKLIESQKVSVLSSVPSSLILMVLYGDFEACDLSHLRVITFGAEVFPAKYLSRLMALIPSARFFHRYGSTETGMTAEYEVKSLDPGRVSPIPIGKAPKNAEIFAIDSDGRRIEKPGEKGELYVRGPMIMQGYWGDPERTARTLVKNPLRPDLEERVFRTGDFVTIDHEGNYVFLGREDAMVKSRGKRLELGEIEATMYAHPAVKEVAVVPVPDDLIGNRIVAFVILLDGSSVKREDLLAHCARRLPRYMVPSSIELCDSLPRTSTGKIDKVSLIKEEVARGKGTPS
jgi:amino acid adenylation domain-containing protein